MTVPTRTPAPVSVPTTTTTIGPLDRAAAPVNVAVDPELPQPRPSVTRPYAVEASVTASSDPGIVVRTPVVVANPTQEVSVSASVDPGLTGGGNNVIVSVPVEEAAVDTAPSADIGDNNIIPTTPRYVTVLQDGTVVVNEAAQLNFSGSGVTVTAQGSTANIVISGGNGSGYGNSNVVTLLSSFGSNTLSTTGNITAGYFVGNGSQLTGLPASYGNSNVVTLLAGFGSNTLSTTGNVTGGNLKTTGIVSATGNVTAATFVGSGVTAAAANAVVSLNAFDTDGNTVSIQAQGNTAAAVIETYFDGANNRFTWSFDNSGTLTFPRSQTSIFGGYDNNFTINTSNANTGTAYTFTFSQFGDLSVPVNLDVSGNVYTNDIVGPAAGNVAITANTKSWLFDNNGTLTLPGNSQILPAGNTGVRLSAGASDVTGLFLNNTGDAELYANSNVSVYTDGGNIGWTFDNTGNLNLPNNGSINFAAGGITQATDEDFVITVNDADDDGFAIFNRITDEDGNIVAQTEMQRDRFEITVDVQGAAYNWQFSDNEGILYLPGNVQGNYGASTSFYATDNGSGGSMEMKTVSYIGDTLGSNIRVTQSNATVSTGNAAYTWTFDNTGNLTVPGNSIVSTANAIGNVSGKSITIKAGAADQTDYYATPGGNINITGGLGATNDGGGGGQGGSINITAGASADPAGVAGNIIINTGGANTWTFDNTGDLTAPGDIQAQNIRTVEDKVHIGQNAGLTSQGANAVSIGTYAGQNTQGSDAIAIGQLAGNSTQGSLAVAIGSTAGANTQGGGAVAVGYDAGEYSQGNIATALGAEAGKFYQSTTATAVGTRAGNWNQGAGAVAIGKSAAENISNSGSQGLNAVAIGNTSGYLNQGNSAIAIGAYSGLVSQGQYSIAIGDSAGRNSAGGQGIGNNSIILNATGANFAGTTANSFYVNPVRNDVANIGQVVFYNTTSKEVTYGNTISVAGNVTGNYFVGNGSALTSITGANVTDTVAQATLANTVAVSSVLLNQEYVPALLVANTGNLGIKAADGTANITYNPAQNRLTVENMVVGNAITATGNISAAAVTASGKIGYSAGANVTQTTSRGTSVTLNALSGEITLVSATMAAGAVDTFTMTNNKVSADDMIVCTTRGGTFGTYLPLAYTITDTQVAFVIRNLDSSTTGSEAPVIKFVVIKAPKA